MKGAVVAGLAALFLTLAGAASPAEGGHATRGMVVVAMGGGSLEATFPNGVGEATFSFFAGFDKKGALKGSFFAKRLIPDRGIAAVKSTEITDVQVGIDGSGAWVTVTGLVDFMPTWSNQHFPGHRFTLQAWDYDGLGDGVDMIWFEVKRPYPDDYVRPAISLTDPCELEGGNILIPVGGLE